MPGEENFLLSSAKALEPMLGISVDLSPHTLLDNRSSDRRIIPWANCSKVSKDSKASPGLLLFSWPFRRLLHALLDLIIVNTPHQGKDVTRGLSHNSHDRL